jgi:hypothetical protein
MEIIQRAMCRIQWESLTHPVGFSGGDDTENGTEATLLEIMPSTCKALG